VWWYTHRSGGGFSVELKSAARLGPFRRPGGVCHPFAFSEQKGATMSMVRMIVGGVDTHADTHVAAAIDSNGGILGAESSWSRCRCHRSAEGGDSLRDVCHGQ